MRWLPALLQERMNGKRKFWKRPQSVFKSVLKRNKKIWRWFRSLCGDGEIPKVITKPPKWSTKTADVQCTAAAGGRIHRGRPCWLNFFPGQFQLISSIDKDAWANDKLATQGKNTVKVLLRDNNSIPAGPVTQFTHMWFWLRRCHVNVDDVW